MDYGTAGSIMKNQTHTYLSRYSYKDSFLDHIPVSGDLGIIITIPSYNEPNLLTSLESIAQCNLPGLSVEVIVVINQPVDVGKEIDRQNTDSYSAALKWKGKQPEDKIKYHIIYIKDLRSKDAGVGLARKIAMDEAVRRFARINNGSGIIVGFDADSVCSPNYLIEIENKFNSNSELDGVSIYFEHPIGSEMEEKHATGITSYEFHLRYFIHALRYAGFPYAFHCVGSSMAVRVSAYTKQGGMNKRKAGEDFYFLQKIIQLGNFDEINTAKVIPSSRISDRVPFGTGRAMLEWSESEMETYLTYNPKSFEDLKVLFSLARKLYTINTIDLPVVLLQLPESIRKFISVEEWIDQIRIFKNQSNSGIAFNDKFFNWMNGLKTLQFIHFARDHFHQNVKLEIAYNWLSISIIGLSPNMKTIKDGLSQLRYYDQKHPYRFIKKTFFKSNRIST